MSVILGMLNILSANISRFTVMFKFYPGLPHLLLLLSNIGFSLVCRNHFYPSEICNLHILPEQKCLFMTYTSHEPAEKVADGSSNELIISGMAVVILCGTFS